MYDCDIIYSNKRKIFLSFQRIFVIIISVLLEAHLKGTFRGYQIALNHSGECNKLDDFAFFPQVHCK